MEEARKGKKTAAEEAQEAPIPSPEVEAQGCKKTGIKRMAERMRMPTGTAIMPEGTA